MLLTGVLETGVLDTGVLLTGVLETGVLLTGLLDTGVLEGVMVLEDTTGRKFFLKVPSTAYFIHSP